MLNEPLDFDYKEQKRTLYPLRPLIIISSILLLGIIFYLLRWPFGRMMLLFGTPILSGFLLYRVISFRPFKVLNLWAPLLSIGVNLFILTAIFRFPDDYWTAAGSGAGMLLVMVILMIAEPKR